MSLVVLVRHGQTEWNMVERFRGRFDIPLNETGLMQAEATAERIASSCKPETILTSPLSRARQTADPIARKTGLTPRAQQGLIDIDYGEWQGLTPEEVRARWPKECRSWYEDPGAARIPGGETLAEVQERALKTALEACGEGTSEAIVMVSHTVVNRLILLGVLGAPLDRFWLLRQDPCAINVLEFHGSSFTLVTMNDTCHLPGRG
jgi:broad specificity phosphatase PhoE